MKQTNILIIEDELPAARKLRRMIEARGANYRILDVIDSVEDASAWLKTFPDPDLIFLDIQLSDGLSFSIFEEVQPQSSIIFTTAYNQYALKAFKLNSVDYLLKPIQEEELDFALHKYTRFQPSPSFAPEMLQSLMQQMKPKSYKERYMVKVGQHFAYVAVSEIRYFQADGGVVFVCDQKGKRFILDKTLDNIMEELNPQKFFRISRSVVVHIEAIQRIENYFNGRLLLHVNPPAVEQLFVSRSRVSDFKEWLGG